MECVKYEESETVELKEIVTENIKKEIVAFANSNGGSVYIGISDSGEITGIDNPDEVIQQISNMVMNSIKPDLSMFIHFETKRTDKGDIVEVKVQRGTGRPYYLTAKGLRPEGVYVRMGTCSVPSTDTAIRNMIKETDGISYEQGRSLEQTLSFSKAEEQFNKKGIEFGDAKLRSLGLMSYDGVYNNCAHILSDQCTHTMKLARFSGITKSVFQDRREYFGSVFSQMEEAYCYIDMNNNIRSSFDGLYRVDSRDYPEDALREALLNAIVHRDYSVNGPTLISIFDDRIEFLSIGGLYGGVSMKDIFMGVSACRNPVLANVFYRLELIEAYGCGIQKIMDAYRNSTKKPEILTGDNSFKIVLPNLNYNGVSYISSRVSEGVSQYMGESVSAQSSGYSMEIERLVLDSNLNPCSSLVLDRGNLKGIILAVEEDDRGKEKKIEKYLNLRGLISRNEVERLLNVSQATSNRILRKMESEGKLIRQGKGRSTRYSLK